MREKDSGVSIRSLIVEYPSLDVESFRLNIEAKPLNDEPVAAIVEAPSPHR
jgi:hypothetical protein